MRRLLWENEVIKAVDEHTNDHGELTDDISCILEKVNSGWIKCVPYRMPEDYAMYKGRKAINVLVTTDRGNVTQVRRYFDSYRNEWRWGRIRGEMKSWMPLPEPYKED